MKTHPTRPHTVGFETAIFILMVTLANVYQVESFLFSIVFRMNCKGRRIWGVIVRELNVPPRLKTTVALSCEVLSVHLIRKWSIIFQLQFISSTIFLPDISNTFACLHMHIFIYRVCFNSSTVCVQSWFESCTFNVVAIAVCDSNTIKVIWQ